MLLTLQSFGAITFVVSTSVVDPDGAQLVITTPSVDTTGGNFCVASASVGPFSANPGATSITDSKSNTYVPLTLVQSTASTSCCGNSQLWYAENATTGSGHTFTLTAGTSRSSMSVACFGGVAISSSFDVENGATCASGCHTLQTGSVTPGVDNELIIAGYTDNGNAPRTVGIDSGLTVEAPTDPITLNNLGSAIAYSIQTTATASNPEWNSSVTDDSTVLTGTIATFKELGAPGAVTRTHSTVLF